mmetsp:Transcript_112490/g.357589  ORF Transcript_112490/g.357589 Transcript_112490/m.357589 type:complete len:95 (+) Transcript_112490:1480-1764(+)
MSIFEQIQQLSNCLRPRALVRLRVADAALMTENRPLPSRAGLRPTVMTCTRLESASAHRDSLLFCFRSCSISTPMPIRADMGSPQPEFVRTSVQ